MPSMLERVPIPARMIGLERDKRGYPIPVIVSRDKDGAPLFTVNERETQHICIQKKVCPICGQRLDKALWFVGGPLSAFHVQGGYMDSAMHYECMNYALQVCPYMAMPNYRAGEIAGPKMARLQEKVAGGLVLHDPTMLPGKPPITVAVMAYGQSISKSITIRGGLVISPLRPYHSVEFWRDGVKLDFKEGYQFIAAKLDYKGIRLRECCCLLLSAAGIS